MGTYGKAGRAGKVRGIVLYVREQPAWWSSATDGCCCSWELMGQDGQADQHECLCTHIIYVCWFCLFDHSGQPAGVCLDRDVRFEMSSNYDLLVALRNETGLRKSCCWDLHSTLVSCLQGLQVVTSWSFLERAAWTKPKDDIYINLICCVPFWLCSFSLMKQTEILDLE